MKIGCPAPPAESVAIVGLVVMFSIESMPMHRWGMSVCGRTLLSSKSIVDALGGTPSPPRLPPSAPKKALCEGLDVQDIASAHGVSVCTVRTQVRALRLKTGAGSIRLLVQRVAALPPLVPMSLAASGSGWAQSHA